MSSNPPSIKSGTYYIRNIGTETVMELPGGSAADAIPIVAHAQRPTSDALVASQLWIVSQVGSDNTYTIENANSRSYLGVAVGGPGTTRDNLPTGNFHFTGEPWQQWTISRSTNPDITAFVMSDKASGSFSTITNGSNANGAPIAGFTGVGPATTDTRQLWNFVHA